MLIQTKNLQKVYGDEDAKTVALSDVTLSIDKGEFVSIMGSSGSGKSTLLHILGFLDAPTSGEYKFNEKTLESYSEDERAHIRNTKLGFVFQAFNLLPRTSVLENVKLPLLYSSVPEKDWEKQAQKAIEQVGLAHRINHQPSQLSGGEKQRVAIARALVNRPDVIFADEPTGNLDTKSGQMVMEAIQSLHDKHGHTVILITHETETAEHAERIVTMKDGAILKDEKVKNRRTASNSFHK